MKRNKWFALTGILLLSGGLIVLAPKLAEAADTGPGASPAEDSGETGSKTAEPGEGGNGAADSAQEGSETGAVQGKAITVMEKEGVITFREEEDKSVLRLYQKELELPPGIPVETGITNENMAMAISVVDDLRIICSAGETDLTDGDLGELSQEEQEAFLDRFDWGDSSGVTLLDAQLADFGDQRFAMGVYYEQEEQSTIVMLTTVEDGICYTVSGYVTGMEMNDTYLEILVGMAASLEEVNTP